MSHGFESSDFEWLDVGVQRSSGSVSSISSETRSSQFLCSETRSSQFLKEGYLHVMEKLPKKAESAQIGRARSLVRRLSNPATLGGWSRRWCVLSQTADSELQEDESPWLETSTFTWRTSLAASQVEGDNISTSSEHTLENSATVSDISEVSTGKNRISESSDSLQTEGLHLLLYKDQSSFSNMQAPIAVLPLDGCSKLCSLPTHSKSEFTFSISLNNRDILFYTDTNPEFEAWLKILQDTLKLQDAYFHSPLKGLPKQKAMRKDSSSQNMPHQQHEASRDGDSPTNQEDTATIPAAIPTTAVQSTEGSVKNESHVAGVIAGVAVQRKHFLFNKRHSESNNTVKVLNIKKLVPETC